MPIVQMFLLGLIVVVTVTLLYFVPVGMWIQGIVSLGVGRIRIVDLIRMRLRKISPRLVTDGVIASAIETLSILVIVPDTAFVEM